MVYRNATEIVRTDLAGPLMQEAHTFEAYVATQVLPPLMVSKRTGQLPTIVRTNDQVLTLKRGREGTYKRIQLEADKKTFVIEDEGIEVPLDETDVELLGQDGAEMTATRAGAHATLRATDAALADLLMTSWTGDTLAATNVWGSTSADELKDAARAKEVFIKKIGLPPNGLLISRSMATKLMYSPAIRTQVRALRAQAGDMGASLVNLTAQQIGQILDVPRVVIGDSIKNSAGRGLTASRSFIWPDTYALWYRYAEGDDLTQPHLGRTLMWNEGMSVEEMQGYIDAALGLVVESYREPQTRRDIIRVRQYKAPTVWLTDAGLLMTGG